jgi:hypothetical protein
VGESSTTTISILGKVVLLASSQPSGYNSYMKSNRKALGKIKTVTIRGNRYNFVVKKLRAARGLTEDPSTKNKTVYIDEREQGKELLATLIDEFIHCAIWELRNDVVDEISDDIADALWRCGLRFTEEIDEQPAAPDTTD